MHRLLHSVRHRAGEPAKDPKSTHRLLHSMRQRAGEPETPWRTGFYTQSGGGLGNQRKSQEHTQAFTLSVAKGWRTRDTWHAQAFTLRAAQGWGTRETFRVHTQAFTLNAAQGRWNQWNLFISTSTQLWRARVRDFPCIPDEGSRTYWFEKKRFFFFGRIFNDHVITNAIRGMLSNYYYNFYYARKFMYYVVHLLFYCMFYLILSYFVLPFVIYFVLSIFIKLYMKYPEGHMLMSIFRDHHVTCLLSNCYYNVYYAQKFMYSPFILLRVLSYSFLFCSFNFY